MIVDIFKTASLEEMTRVNEATLEKKLSEIYDSEEEEETLEEASESSADLDELETEMTEEEDEALEEAEKAKIVEEAEKEKKERRRKRNPDTMNCKTLISKEVRVFLCVKLGLRTRARLSYFSLSNPTW